MTQAKERPNFRIIEPEPIQLDYDEFKQDFMNPYMTVDEIKDKYNLTNGGYNDFRERVLEDTGLKKKPCYCYGKHNTSIAVKYIQKKPNGYIIVKKFGRATKYYGRYLDYNTAKLVRDELVKSDWDYTTGNMLMEKYSVHSRRPPALETAKLLYKEFENEYFHGEDNITVILKRMGISRMVYRYLIQMIREKHPTVKFRPRCRT